MIYLYLKANLQKIKKIGSELATPYPYKKVV